MAPSPFADSLRIGCQITLVSDAGDQTVTVAGEYLSDRRNFQVVSNIDDPSEVTKEQGPTGVETGLTEETNASTATSTVASQLRV